MLAGKMLPMSTGARCSRAQRARYTAPALLDSSLNAHVHGLCVICCIVRCQGLQIPWQSPSLSARLIMRLALTLLALAEDSQNKGCESPKGPTQLPRASRLEPCMQGCWLVERDRKLQPQGFKCAARTLSAPLNCI